MTPATIIEQARADGVTLALSPAGCIKAAGNGEAVNRWLPVLREHKAELLDELRAGMVDREAFEERAAIMEFDGGLTRAEAERLALLERHGATVY